MSQLLPDHGPNPHPTGTIAGDAWELVRALRHTGRLILEAAEPLLDAIARFATRLEEYNERRKLDAGRKARNRRKTNRAAFKRLDRSQCAVCDSTYQIEAHHIVPRSKFAKGETCDVDENLLPVCHECHQHHHTTGHRRIPRRALTPAQEAFAVNKQGPVWVDKWYPKDTA